MGKSTNISTEHNELIELIYRFGNMLNLRSQWAITKYITNGLYYQFPESISSKSQQICTEITSRFSSSIFAEFDDHGGFLPAVDFLENLEITLDPKKVGGVCDLAGWSSNEHLCQMNGEMTIPDLSAGDYHLQLYLPKESNFGVPDGPGWEGIDIKKYLGWKLKEYGDDSSNTMKWSLSGQ